VSTTTAVRPRRVHPPGLAPLGRIGGGIGPTVLSLGAGALLWEVGARIWNVRFLPPLSEVLIRLGELTDLPPLSDGPLLTTSAIGWVADGDDTEAYIQLVDPRCTPRPVSLATLEAMQPWEQLACFGPEQITLEGTFGCSGCAASVPGTFEPGWLAHPMNFGFLSVDPNARIGPFAMRFAPSGPPPPAVGQIVRVVGHFDDPAAGSCTISPGEPPVPLDPLATGLYCREQFVVESFEVTGTDPDFP